MSHRARRRAARLACGVVLASATAVPLATSAAAESAPAGPPTLYLVTLHDPGTAALHTVRARRSGASHRLAEQQQVLDVVGSPTPTYRWTTALDGFAVPLTADQAAVVAALPSVALVEPNTVRPLAAISDAPSALPRPHRPSVTGVTGVTGPRHGGRGEVIGLVDTGIAPASPLFAQLQGAATPQGGHVCQVGDGWSASDCNGKIVSARWYVAGFGAGAIGSAASLSPRDTDGHGTQMASIAAGDAAVPVQVSGERLGRYGGMAPDARLAVYKACWTAPEPSRDGCATADLVAAIDQATADRVDVLSLSVGGPDRVDTVERALLGAAESGAVVTAAAGNEGRRAYAAHPSPWVTTVGGATGTEPRGRVVVRRGPSLSGAMLSRRGAGLHRVVIGARVPATGYTAAQARVCTPSSLDAARVEGAVVVCQRGRVSRVDKSRAVELADGVAMVLVNVRPGSTDADVQSVPTVHLSVRPGRVLVRYVARHPHARVRLAPAATTGSRPRVAAWSSAGDVRAAVVKPDLLAPGTGVLGAVPGGARDGWDFVSGSSAATAYTSGVAATLLSRPGWSPAEVRSALATTAVPLRGSALLRTGAGRVSPARATRPGLAYLEGPGAWRGWLDGRRAHLNTPSVLLSGGADEARRTVTNVGHRRLYFSSSAVGFRSDVTVTPAALRLGPGRSATFTIRVLGRRQGGRVDDGYVVWRGATGTVTRIPVVLAR